MDRSRGVYGTTMSEKMLVILVFKLFCGFYTFSRDEQNFENKQLMDSLKVKIGI